MTEKSLVPERVRVKVSRAAIGVWVAESQDLQDFLVVSSDEALLRASISLQIELSCRARGFEIVTCPIGNIDKDTILWSITVRNAIPATGPIKVGETGRERSSAR